MVAKFGWNSSAPEWMDEAARAAYTYSGVSALEEERNSHTGWNGKSLEDMILSETSLPQKDKCRVITLVWGPSRQEVDGGWQGLREGGGKWLFNGDRVSDLQDEKSYGDFKNWKIKKET